MDTQLTIVISINFTKLWLAKGMTFSVIPVILIDLNKMQFSKIVTSFRDDNNNKMLKRVKRSFTEKRRKERG